MKVWDGKLTPEIRQKLHEKRISLNASFKSVGAVLDVAESSVQKWEKGTVGCVTITVRGRITDFLDGELDDDFKQWRKPRAERGTNIGESGTLPLKSVPPELREVFDHVSVVYKACRVKPEAQTELLLAVEKAAEDVLTRLASGKTGK